MLCKYGLLVVFVYGLMKRILGHRSKRYKFYPLAMSSSKALTSKASVCSSVKRWLDYKTLFMALNSITYPPYAEIGTFTKEGYVKNMLSVTDLFNLCRHQSGF